MTISSATTIFTAREVVTLDKYNTSAKAVAVSNGRIVATGSTHELKNLLDKYNRQYTIDKTFEDHVIVPGFIAQHDHPVLGGLTMSSLILSIEDWELPTGTAKAITSKADFMQRMKKANAELGESADPLLTWGYHATFFGKLNRNDLDLISTERPIFVWARSCHEFVLNTRAMNDCQITEELMASWPPSAQEQSNFEDAHFWEQGLFAILENIAPFVANPVKFNQGLGVMRDFMHSKGITFGNEPGGILSMDVQKAVNDVMSSPTMPFRWTFIPDGKSLITTSDVDAEVIKATEDLESWYHGMTSMMKKSVKLFSDGAIYSLAMQLRKPPIGDYHGEWMMDKEVFERAFQVYWDAGYQVHIHVNGDAGLDRVLDNLERNMVRNPRSDHRTVCVHFAVSAKDQVERIRRLGAIVSANPYYVTALSDKYGEEGLGKTRADHMVRLRDVEKAGVSFSLHSDMPMAPGDPLFLMWCAVNRLTTSGRVAASRLRVSAEAALRGVTIEAAYSHGLENELGSIEPGKLANFTILEENPLDVDEMAIKDIGVWGTVLEGRVQKVGDVIHADGKTSLRPGVDVERFTYTILHHAVSVVCSGFHDHRGNQSQ